MPLGRTKVRDASKKKVFQSAQDGGGQKVPRFRNLGFQAYGILVIGFRVLGFWGFRVLGIQGIQGLGFGGYF